MRTEKTIMRELRKLIRERKFKQFSDFVDYVDNNLDDQSIDVMENRWDFFYAIIERNPQKAIV